ncbi:MAG TPA: hypothetical protein IAA60_00020 [Candidatus Ornithomonoglobus intestinigallinarum]|uniref:Uncharacterized protein n=1 Tax=Candidatus Ornithomonoglobus intestinigallinarum TaxID=2840894 RepID=A0A9D1KP43_9FIRM|nr:hypothetical protein [Candidatus Ornithomonoglobus intestinigallinarum]
MKKNYTEPTISVRKFLHESIVTESGNHALDQAARAVTNGSLSINGKSNIPLDELVKLNF